MIENSFPVAPPLKLKPWLIHKEKLSDKLIKKAGQAQLIVLNHQETVSGWYERYSLNIKIHNILSREILMLANANPCWYARSIYPDSFYRTEIDFFRRLQNGSLGDLLYNNPLIQRMSLHYYPVDANMLEYYWLRGEWKEDDSIFWMRKSHFCYKKVHHFYLMEILLPGLLKNIS